jgi:hypothetical protein
VDALHPIESKKYRKASGLQEFKSWKKNCRLVHLHNQSTESKIYLIPLYKTCLSLTCKQAAEIQTLKKK